jgi:hypothetical protein
VAVPYANLTNPQTLNLYAMVSDDPESFADLDGHGGCGDYLSCESPHGGPEYLSDDMQADFAASRAGPGVTAPPIYDLTADHDSVMDPEIMVVHFYVSLPPAESTHGSYLQSAQSAQTPAQPAQAQVHLTKAEELELAAAAYGKQANADQAQHQAIISVMINRANTPGRHGRYPSIQQVIHKHGAFQGVPSARFRNGVRGRANKLPGFQDAKAAVQSVEQHGVTTNATYFYHGTPSAGTLHRMAPNATLVPASPGAVGDLHLYVPE